MPESLSFLHLKPIINPQFFIKNQVRKILNKWPCLPDKVTSLAQKKKKKKTLGPMHSLNSKSERSKVWWAFCRSWRVKLTLPAW